MATAIAEEIRTALVERGLWGDFCRRRSDIPRGNGVTGAVASEKVLGEIAPDLVGLLRKPGRPRKGSSGDKSRTYADVRLEKRDARMAGRSSGGEDVRVNRETFRGKSCSLSSAFMWAYSNISVSDVAPEEAPSAVAWQLLVDMRSSPSIKADLLKSGLSAAMRKAEGEEDAGTRFDGEGEYDICKSIAEACGQ